MQHRVAFARVCFAIWSRTCREEDLKLGGTAAQVAHLKAVTAEPLRQAPAGARARRSQRLAARRKRTLRISVPCRSVDTIQSSQTILIISAFDFDLHFLLVGPEN